MITKFKLFVEKVTSTDMVNAINLNQEMSDTQTPDPNAQQNQQQQQQQQQGNQQNATLKVTLRKPWGSVQGGSGHDLKSTCQYLILV